MHRILTTVTRASTQAMTSAARQVTITPCAFASQKRFYSHAPTEGPEEFDQRFVDYFNRSDIDGWEVRHAMVQLNMHDVIPDPKIVAAALRACRRVNELAVAIRFLEQIKIKCRQSKQHTEQVYPWIIQEVRPVLDELGIPTPEELGFDKPELYVPDPNWYWERDNYKEYGYEGRPGYQF